MGQISTRILEQDNDFLEKFRSLQQAAHATAIEKGWWNPPKTFGEQLALFHSEISEALEEFRKGRQPQDTYHSHPSNIISDISDPNSLILVPDFSKPEGVPIEFADLLIRLLDTCEFYDIDLISAVIEKMKYNETRSFRHGNKVL